MKKRYLIIGGSRGIGAKTAQSLLEEGHEVFVIARNQPAWDGNYTFLQADVLADELPVIEGGLDGMAYCLGSINLKPFKNLKAKDFQADFEINAMGAVKCLQQYQNNLKAVDQSAVVLFSTVAVQTGMAFHASVGMAKGAIEGLVRSLAAEWAPKIRVNAIAPSITATDLASRLLRNDKQREAAAGRHPLKKIGNPEDVANLAKFLLSDTATWMTGQVIGLDGGMSSIKSL